MSRQAVFIIAQNNFRDEELLVPKEILAKKQIKKIKKRRFGRYNLGGGEDVRDDRRQVWNLSFEECFSASIVYHSLA